MEFMKISSTVVLPHFLDFVCILLSLKKKKIGFFGSTKQSFLAFLYFNVDC